MRMLAASLLLFPGSVLAEVPGPPRPLTDPGALAAPLGEPLPPPTVASLFEARDSGGAGWIEGGRALVASANISGRFNLWRFPVAGGPATRLTTSDERQMSPVVGPDGRTIVFESDVGGGEMFDLVMIEPGKSIPHPLTSTPDVSETGAVFARNGKLIAFASKRRTDAAADLALLDIATGITKTLTVERESGVRWTATAFSPDGKMIYANRLNISSTLGSLWRISLVDGHATPIGPSGTDIFTTASDLSSDGKMLAIASNSASEEQRAGILSLSDGRITWIEPSPWRQRSGQFSGDGHKLVWSANVDGRTTAYLYDIAKRRSQMIAMPPGTVSSGRNSIFTPDGKRLLLGHQASNVPFEYWSYDIARRQPTRMTSLSATLDARALPPSQLVRYRSKDGTVISAFVWLPYNLKRNGTAPAVAFPHGGPTGQMTDFFNRTAVALASRGYVVIAPNFRGSTGYGKAFQAANIGDLGGGDLDDMVAGAKFLVATGYVDARRIGITGGSYGGVMTAMALAKTPEPWAAGVDLFGILDWRTLAKTSDPSLKTYVRDLLGDPVANAKLYEKASPVTWIDGLRAPLQVQQGDNDIRTPKSEAVALVAALEARGRTVEAHYYPKEGHGFARRENQIDSLEKTIAWFDRWLKDDR